MAISVEIKGVDKTSYLGKNSLRIRKNLGNQNSLGCKFNCKSSDWLPKAGQDIKVYDGATLLFGGVIKNVTLSKLEPKKNSSCYVEANISSNGYNDICSRRNVTLKFKEKTAGYIFEYLVDNVLNDPSYDENVTKGSITAGNTFFNTYNMICKSVKGIMDDLAEQSGVKWYIDDTKTIHFISESTITTALYTIDVSGSFTDYQVLNYTESLENYCNKVFVKGTGDTYVEVEDTAEQTSRIAIEGTAYTSGVYGKIVEANDLSTETAMQTVGLNELKKYSFAPSSISVKTYNSGFNVGEKISCYIPELGMTANTDYLVNELMMAREATDIIGYEMALVKRNSADFSSQSEEKGIDFFKKKILNPPPPPLTNRGIFNVIDYGAIGNDSFDNTDVLQDLLDDIGDDGGVLYFPAGTYKITSALDLYSNISIKGDGSHVSMIKQYTDNEDGLYAMDKHNMSFWGIGVIGTNGVYTANGTGTGIKLNRSSNPNLTYCTFNDVWVYRFGRDGLDIMTILVSTFDKVHCEENGRYGFYFHEKSGTNAPCTSCTFNSCYANSNYQYGFYLVKCTYFSFNGCACDGTTTLGQTTHGYVIDFGQGISFNGCAAESVSTIGFYFTNTCYGCGCFQCWSYDLQGTAFIKVGTGSQQIQIIGGAITDPNTAAGTSAINSIVVESACRTTVIGTRIGDVEESLYDGTTTWIDGGLDGDTVFPAALYSTKLYTDYIATNETSILTIDADMSIGGTAVHTASIETEKTLTASAVVTDSAYVDYIGTNNTSVLTLDCDIEVAGKPLAPYWSLYGVSSSAVATNSIFLDSSDGILKWKDSGGTNHDLI